ncbi:hypothetical protein BO71DRAFT_435434 [Aspergillus ellipticus CBS 707.79]|uniref:Uncharacterized protein n=1 Tax=Aspergillus ellipticus CBS 707.79 TaxID=1448320 RepID=A0A319CU29_9EURO|nr:hypothetical protein BO71DRAFT_435434 [Aspergillus ellipticus CBS 707.79]
MTSPRQGPVGLQQATGHQQVWGIFGRSERLQLRCRLVLEPIGKLTSRPPTCDSGRKLIIAGTNETATPTAPVVSALHPSPHTPSQPRQPEPRRRPRVHSCSTRAEVRFGQRFGQRHWHWRTHATLGAGADGSWFMDVIARPSLQVTQDQEYGVGII